jgi:hypothetical protein
VGGVLPAGCVNPIFTHNEFALAQGKGVELAGYPVKAFGVVFGVAVSQAQYDALAAAQGLNVGACVVAGHQVQGYTNPACAPSIPAADYRSIMTNNAAASLVAAYEPIEWARRDLGSGTKSGENAYFLNQGCSIGSATTEAGALHAALPSASTANETISYNYSTGQVINRLNGTTATAHPNVMGVISAENDSASGLTGAAGGTASMLKLDGLYPSAANAAAGAYPYMTTEWFHCSPLSAAGVCAAISADFTTLATGGGIVNLTNAATFFANNGNACNGGAGLVRVR